MAKQEGTSKKIAPDKNQIVINPLAAHKVREEAYKASGKWRCLKSPSGAHVLLYHNATKSSPSLFECEICGYKKEVQEEAAYPSVYQKRPDASKRNAEAFTRIINQRPIF